MADFSLVVRYTVGSGCDKTHVARVVRHKGEALVVSGDDAAEPTVALLKAGLRFRVSAAQRTAVLASWGVNNYTLDLQNQCGAMLSAQQQGARGGGVCGDPWFRP